MQNGVDPYTPEGSVYECLDCSYRVAVDGHRGSCTECGGVVKNIAIPRE